MSIHSLIQFPEELRSAAAVRAPLGGMPVDGLRPRALVELRSDMGSLYVRPSGWQRLRLLWTFRHFHLLSPDILSHRDQRLIERLSRSAVVSPSSPVPEEAILGVVEKALTHSAKSPLLVVPSRPVAFRQQLSPRAAAIRQAVAELEARGLRAARMRRWGALAMLLCVFVALGVAIAMLVTGLRERRVTMPAEIPAAQSQKVAAPVAPAALATAPPAIPIPTQLPLPQAVASAPSPEKTHRAKAVAEPAQPAAVSSNADVEFPILADLPPGPLVKPVVSNPRLVGNLRLKALVGADGVVKDVTVLSGNPRLAEAAMRAVRRWRYAPQGRSGDAQALIGMSFFGPDAISITSLAK
jgi:periplasmic protein TonB